MGKTNDIEFENLLNEYITNSKYGNFKDVIQEVLRRRMIAFDFDTDRMRREITNLINNLDHIEIGTVGGEAGENYVHAGVYLPEDKKIVIDKEYLSSTYHMEKGIVGENELRSSIGQRWYSVLTHELYHAINARQDDKCIGLEYVFNKEFMGPDDEIQKSGGPLNEIFTEKAAFKTCVNGNIENFNRGYTPTLGYSYATFMVPLYAQALGVSEKDLLREGLDTYERLEDYFKGCLYQDDIISDKSMQSFRNTLSYTFLTWKRLEKNTNNTAMYTILKNVGDAFKCLKNQIQLSEHDLTPEYIGEINTRLTQMYSICSTYNIDSVNSNEYSKEQALMIAQSLDFVDGGPLVEEVAMALNQVKDLNYMYIENIPKYSPEYEAALQGQLVDYYKVNNPDRYQEYSKKSYIDVLRESIGKSNPELYQKYGNYIINSDFNPNLVWDEEIYERTTDIIQMELSKEKHKEILKSPDISKLSKGIDMFGKQKDNDEPRGDSEDDGR